VVYLTLFGCWVVTFCQVARYATAAEGTVDTLEQVPGVIWYGIIKSSTCRGYMWNKTLKLFQNYFKGLLQLMNIFQHV